MIKPRPTERKVIARLMGGLGNQLFIFAFAKVFSMKYGCRLLIDQKSGFTRDTYKREFHLEKFITRLECAPDKYCYLGIKGRILRRVSRFLNRHLRWKRYFYEKSNIYFPVNISLGKQKGIYLDGYWQSPRYFSGYEDILRSSIIIPNVGVKLDSLLPKTCGDCSPVAVHVRVNWKIETSLTIHERNKDPKLISPTFYNKATEYMAQLVNNPFFLIFTDNFDWCREFLEFSLPHTNVLGMTAIEDFSLMSHCHHFIIANSTFSWWAAWLSENPDKKVICPNRSHWDNRDIIPEKWIEL